MGSIFELLRRLGSASADGAAGFLFSESVSTKQEEQEEDHSQKSLDVPADSAEVKDMPQVRDSPLDSLCQDLTESMDSLDASNEKQGEGFSMAADLPSQGEDMNHAR